MSEILKAENVRAHIAELHRMRARHKQAEEAQQALICAGVLAIILQRDFPEVESISYSSWGCPVDKHDARKPKNPADALLDKDKPNPLGFCVYDNHRDPCNDHCLYCGGPRERK